VSPERLSAVGRYRVQRPPHREPGMLSSLSKIFSKSSIIKQEKAPFSSRQDHCEVHQPQKGSQQ
jgi:hypothetical protein